MNQVGDALGTVPTSPNALNQATKNSTGIKHTILRAVQKRLQKLPSANSALHASVGVTKAAFEVLIGIFFTFAVAAYWIFERDRARRLLLSLLAHDHRKTVRDTWDLIDAKLGAFVRGQLVLIAFVGTVLSLAFWAIGVPFAVPIAAVLVTLVDVIVRDKDPSDEDVPTLLFPAKDAEA